MSNDAIAEHSPEYRKGRRTGIVLCAVSAVAMLVAVILITGRLFFLGSENLRATDPEKVQEMAPAGAESKN